MSSFNLLDNAFALLATHPRANRAQLEDAYQDAFLDAEDHETEARLNRAQQSLVSPSDYGDSALISADQLEKEPLNALSP